MFRIFGKPALAACAVCLWSCDIFSALDFEPRPGRLRPDTDAFSDGSQRTFTWAEGVDSLWPDSPSVSRRVTVQDLGDTVLVGQTLRRLSFTADDGGPLPAAVVSSLAFDPARMFPDTAIPDPGPTLGFPEFPQIGWRREIVAGDLRLVRELQGVDTLDRPEGLVEAWVFADSAYWDQQAVASASLWLGRRGLLRLHAVWADAGSGSWWREITAR